MKLTNEVIKLNCTRGAYSYAVIGRDGATLIDTGNPGKGEAILTELAANNITPDDIKRILLTHHDIDHIGNAAFLQEKTNCEIFIHSEDYPYIMEGKKREGFKRMVGSLIKAQRPGKIKKIEGNTIGEFNVIPSPGHTKGHTVYSFRDVLFIGDLARSKNGKVLMLPSLYVWDKTVLQNSIKTLPVDGVEWFCPAHGEPFKAAAWNKMRNS